MKSTIKELKKEFYKWCKGDSVDTIWNWFEQALEEAKAEERKRIVKEFLVIFPELEDEINYICFRKIK